MIFWRCGVSCFYDFPLGTVLTVWYFLFLWFSFKNCSDGVVFLCFYEFPLRTVLTVWYFLFLWFSFRNCSDGVVFLCFYDFPLGTVLTVWCFLFIWFPFRNCSDGVVFLVSMIFLWHHCRRLGRDRALDFTCNYNSPILWCITTVESAKSGSTVLVI